MHQNIKKTLLFLVLLTSSLARLHADTELEQQLSTLEARLQKIENSMNTVDSRIETARTLVTYTVVGLGVIAISLLIYDKWFDHSEKSEDTNDEDVDKS